jgi:hypothetical protein
VSVGASGECQSMPWNDFSVEGEVASSKASLPEEDRITSTPVNHKVAERRLDPIKPSTRRSPITIDLIAPGLVAHQVTRQSNIFSHQSSPTNTEV